MREYTLNNASKTKKINFKAIEKAIKKGVDEKVTVKISKYYEAKIFKGCNDSYYVDVVHVVDESKDTVDSFNARIDENGEVFFFYCPINAN